MGCIKVNPDQVSAGAAVHAPAVVAEVGTKMNGDGPDPILAVNSPILGWVWALHATSVKDIGVLLNVDGASSICG